MSNKVNYFKIGLFIICSVAILITGIILLSAGLFEGDTLVLETYLDETVQGLEVGSPVKQRGVQIGRVTKITFVPQEYDMPYGTAMFSKYSKYVMVVMSVERGKFPIVAEGRAREMVESLTRDGLRLILSYQGITGIAYINADYIDPARHAAMKIKWEPRNLYIPAAPSVLKGFAKSADSIFQTIERIDFVGISASMEKAFDSLIKATEDAQVPAVRAEILGLITEVRKTNRLILGLMDKSKVGADSANTIDFVGIAESLHKVLNALDTAIADLQVPALRKEASGLVAEIRKTNRLVLGMIEKKDADPDSGSIPQAIDNFNKMVTRLDKLIQGRQMDIEDILNNLRSASLNLQKLTEYAKKHPSQALFGAPPPRSETVK